ncbi:hypothetical protein ILUMI_10296 [Ignelater luminosus]|uniref:Uncharacterized protein n=1 Tax=Ignelater luminosus TaxID=2038154 RepID=A0A8K0D465_IGNLU|nr:hypothetical protein ILUMI_10296 [Ignelater luminosus]
MLLKALLVVCGILAVQSEEVKNPILRKTFHSDYFNGVSENSNQDVEGGAIVLKSNLPIAIQNKLAAILTQIYQGTQNELERAQAFQTNLAQLYSVYWNVIINFDVITFYSQYYILLQINGDRVLGFGLS